MEDGLHLLVSTIEHRVLDGQVVMIVLVDAALVEDAEHLVQMIIDLAVQTGYLYKDAIVVQTVHKLVGDAFYDRFVLIVERLVANINDRIINVADSMSQQVDSHHRDGRTVRPRHVDVLRVLVVYAQILTEAQRLRGKPRLL